MKKRTRMLALFLCVVMLISLMPMSVFAAKGDSTTRYSVLILDTSGSMWGTPAAKQREAAVKFCESMLAAEGENHIAIVELNSYSSAGTGFTDDISVLQSYINSLYTGGGTNINEALETAGSLLDSVDEEGAVKNIVLCSDGLPQSGRYTYTGQYTSSDYYDYEYANYAYNTAAALKENYYLYTLGFFHSLSGSDLVFGRRFMEDLQNAGYYEVTDPEELEFTFGQVAENITSHKATGLFFFSSGNERDYSSTYYYDDAYFVKDASEYQESLSTMSLCLALAAYGSNEYDYDQKYQNVWDLLDATGFEAIEVNDYYKQRPSEDSMGVVAAFKPITVNGETFTLVVAATRGGGYEAEWAGDFTVGTTGRHTGFEIAAEITETFLKDYIEKYKSDFQGTVKLWMAGYSRGAATVNLAAADITKAGGIGGVSLDKSNIFAYCFETPKGESMLNISPSAAKAYTNIHNIVNHNDAVTKVAMTGWGFERYGVDEPVIPTKLTSSNTVLFSNMLAKFRAINTEWSNECIVKDSHGKDTHIINTFQGKKIDPNLIDVNNISGSWQWVPTFNPLVPFVYMWVPSVDVQFNPRLVSNTNQSMGAFLDTFVLSLTLGLKNRIEYTNILQPAVRVVTSQFMGKGYEAYKWEQLPGRFTDILKANILNIAFTYVTNGVTGVSTQITGYMMDAVESVGIDLTGYADLPVALTVALADVVSAVVACLGISGGNDLVTLAENLSMLKTGHYPELCLAWMQSQDPNYTPEGRRLFVIDCYRVVHINCPVDVSVYDSQNRLVAQILNDEPQDIEDSLIVASFTSDGEKLIYLPADEDYRVEMTATDQGTVNYSVTEYSYESENYAKIVNYYDIPVSVGDTLIGTVAKFSDADIYDTSEGSSLSYPLSHNGTALQASESDAGEAAEESVFLVTAEAESPYSGNAIGGGAYTEGAYATVGAIAYPDCTFVGWYADDELVSTDTSYRFRVEEPVTLTALFDRPEDLPLEGYTLTASAAEGGTLADDDISGVYAADSSVLLAAIPDDGYEFDQWISSDGTVENPNSDTTYFTMPDANVEIVATFKLAEEGDGDNSAAKRAVVVSDTENGTLKATPSSAAEGETVVITASPKQGYALDAVQVTDVKNQEVPVKANEDGTYSFTMPALGVLVTGTFKAQSSEVPPTPTVTPTPTVKPEPKPVKFVDVPKDAYYYDAVYWAVNTDPVVTTGTDNTHFSPAKNCTRAQMVTFLWRASGEPEPTITKNPFADVKSGDYFYKAVLWAVEKGITKGTTATTFSPNATVTRAQTVTFLWRMAGEPAVNVKNPFADVKAGQYYTDAVLWAVKNKVTTGKTATTFAPNDPCTRAQIVTFLYRDFV